MISDWTAWHIFSLEFDFFNTPLEQYIVFIVIIAASFFTGKYFYSLAKKHVCDFIVKRQNFISVDHLRHIFFLLSLSISLLMISSSLHFLTIDKNIYFWTQKLFHLGYQIIFILILLDTIEPLLQYRQDNHLHNIQNITNNLAKKQNIILDSRIQLIRVILKIFLFLLPISTILSIFYSIPAIGWVIPVFFLPALFLYCCNLFFAPNKQREKLETNCVHGSGLMQADSDWQGDDPDREQREGIVQLFLEVFKHQLGGRADSPSSFSLFARKSSPTNTYVYELRVRITESWKTRRMSIGRVGAESASKAKCFFVIYDEYLVIKIPPGGVRTIDDYVNILRKEKRIVAKIDMKECIIPTVSVMLKHVHDLKQNKDVSCAEREDEYIRLAYLSTQLQRYLKLGDRFVFFMDLSRYYFLQHSIDSIHSLEDKLYKEMTKQAEIAWDLVEFEHRYGQDIVPLVIKIRNQYREFEAQCKTIMAEHEYSAKFNPYQIKLWFFKRLFGYKIKNRFPELSEIAGRITTMENKVFQEIGPIVTSYRRIINNTIYNKAFYQNKAVIEGITVNLLELLAHLHKTEVALRDLKPDNLLVAGKKNEEYPFFLLDPDRYKIGFIDVETAVIFDKKNSKKIDQPQLGGTPLYITPSHFFNNEALQYTFGDLASILHLQDWHAVIGIIYKLVTGETLFGKTALQVPAIINFIKKSKQKGRESSAILIKASRFFWPRAAKEFFCKLAIKEKMLQATCCEISDAGRELLFKYNSRVVEDLQGKIHDCIVSQKIWRRAKHKALLASPPEKINSLKRKIKTNAKTTPEQSKQRQDSLIFLGSLEQLKLKQRRQIQFHNLLAQPQPSLSIFILLQVMFQTVLHHMYQDEWR